MFFIVWKSRTAGLGQLKWRGQLIIEEWILAGNCSIKAWLMKCRDFFPLLEGFPSPISGVETSQGQAIEKNCTFSYIHMLFSLWSIFLHIKMKKREWFSLECKRWGKSKVYNTFWMHSQIILFHHSSTSVKTHLDTTGFQIPGGNNCIYSCLINIEGIIVVKWIALTTCNSRFSGSILSLTVCA